MVTYACEYIELYMCIYNIYFYVHFRSIYWKIHATQGSRIKLWYTMDHPDMTDQRDSIQLKWYIVRD